MKKPERRNLHAPKLTPITKQQYRKFAVVRKLHTQSLGEHTLMSHNHKKYIQKCLGVGESFLTLRAPTQHIYHYAEEETNSYIFQLVGEPLLNMLRGPIGHQLKDWIDRCGGLDNCLLELLRYCVKMHAEKGVDDLVAECFRIWEGKVCYNWDTWMRSSLQIVRDNTLEIENYFLSEAELRYLQNSKSSTQISTVTLTHHEYLYKVGLFLLQLALPEIKIRTYQYCHFSLNHANITERLNLLKIKVNKQLHGLVTKFINMQIQSIEHLSKTLEGYRYGRGDSSVLLSQGSGMKSALKIWQKQKENILVGQDTSLNFNQSRGFESGVKPENLFCKGSSKKKIRMRGRSGNLNQSTNNNISVAEQDKKIDKLFSLKQVFSKPPLDGCTRLTQYLGLDEHISQSLYEKSVISCLESIRVKPSWVHKVYANGSIYLGDMLDDKRNGKGVYLFDSEDLYVGDWNQNCMNGYGCYVFRSGQIYQGELRRGLKHGYGSFTYKDGRIYEGHWEQNTKFGYGNVYFPNAMKFLGFFSKGTQTYGLFTKTHQQGPIQFEGSLERYNWQLNTFNDYDVGGQKSGINLFEDCQKVRDELSGNYTQKGTIGDGRQNEGERYDGVLRRGVRQGLGKVTVKNKFEFEGLWEDGLLVEYKCK